MTTDVRRRAGVRPVLVSSSRPPAIPVDEVVDVRAGSVASFDGDRHALPLWVGRQPERTVVSATAPGELERAVAARVGVGGPATVRFGDLQPIRRLLPGPMADALERRLGRIAAQSDARLVVWTSGDIRRADRGRYDVDGGRIPPWAD